MDSARIMDSVQIIPENEHRGNARWVRKKLGKVFLVTAVEGSNLDKFVLGVGCYGDLCALR